MPISASSGKNEGDQLEEVDTSLLPRFTEAENPFLFPRTLLAPWAISSSSTSASNTTPVVGIAGRSSASPATNGEVAAEDHPKWWLVHTKPRQEKKLAESLGRLEVPNYLPVTKCKALTRGRSRISRMPQFPGYLFLWADRGQRLKALQTNRIVATYPVGCHEELGRHLWDLADLIEKGVPLRVEERLAIGQSVRVKSGLLKDKRGVIINRGGKSRLFVYVSEMLGGVSIEIEQHLVEPY